MCRPIYIYLHYFIDSNEMEMEDIENSNGLCKRYLTAIRTHFTRWLIRTNSYDLTRTI